MPQFGATARSSASLPRFLLRLLKPLAPTGNTPMVMQLRAALRTGPALQSPRFDRVLVVAPHPDDETIGCGATVAQLVEHGSQVLVVAVTAGDAAVVPGASSAEVGEIRTAELQRACKRLGVSERPRVLGLPDGRLADRRDEVTSLLQDTVDEFAPDAVLAPWLGDGHEDHQVVAEAVARLDYTHPVEIWGYEVWEPVPANVLVDVSDQWPAKQAALHEHATAFVGFDASSFLALSRWRAAQRQGGRGHAEAFLALEPGALRDLADAAGGADRARRPGTVAGP